MLLLVCLPAAARHQVFSPDVKTLQVVANGQWLSPPVLRLGSNDVLQIGFDELSHTFHRYVYQLEHCEADWTPSTAIFESDWMEGFNGNTIDDYENSVNTTVLYTHYRLQIPNERCRLKMSGNYKVHVFDEDNGHEEVLCAEFRVVEPIVNVGISASTNTDVDFNQSHQQVSMTMNYGGLRVSNEQQQIYTVVQQNGREDNQCINPRPTSRQPSCLKWEHCRELVFDAGNEYHKFEVLDVSHPTMGIDRILWDGSHYQAYPYACEQRRSYVYDQDANGAFYVRNSENTENDHTCDYVYVNYAMLRADNYPGYDVVIEGQWTTETPRNYVMTYDEAERSYHTRILQKQGYYSYQFLLRDTDGRTRIMPEEGSFFETENRYHAYVYFKGIDERTWRLVGYQEIVLK